MAIYTRNSLSRHGRQFGREHVISRRGRITKKALAQRRTRRGRGGQNFCFVHRKRVLSTGITVKSTIICELELLEPSNKRVAERIQRQLFGVLLDTATDR
jgi:hypothetical protein